MGDDLRENFQPNPDNKPHSSEVMGCERKKKPMRFESRNPQFETSSLNRRTSKKT